MSDVNLVGLWWEESISCRGKGHVQRPWGGSQQHVFSRNYKVSKVESKRELEAETKGFEGECGAKRGPPNRDRTRWGQCHILFDKHRSTEKKVLGIPFCR